MRTITSLLNVHKSTLIRFTCNLDKDSHSLKEISICVIKATTKIIIRKVLIIVRKIDQSACRIFTFQLPMEPRIHSIPVEQLILKLKFLTIIINSTVVRHQIVLIIIFKNPQPTLFLIPYINIKSHIASLNVQLNIFHSL